MLIIKLMRSSLAWNPDIHMLLMAIVPPAGASVLGVVSEYATYNYVIHYGFRPSFEGVPYLKATVTLISFFILFIGALVFAGIVFLIRSFVAQFSIAEKLAEHIATRLLTSDEGKRILATNPPAFAGAKSFR
ncbi:hypothetical protein [Cupriavidus sp. CuC1]|uniref:hypothetical protein n=1 Tax=Cupriavidus sp. CuC1 TaxID=3373131 RepID=UPI0037D7939B